MFSQKSSYAINASGEVYEWGEGDQGIGSGKRGKRYSAVLSRHVNVVEEMRQVVEFRTKGILEDKWKQDDLYR